MALSAGSVTVAPNLSRTGSGLTLALYDAQVTVLAAQYVTAGFAFTQAARQAFADGLRDNVATPLVAYVVANADVEVTIGTGDAGLQRMPASTAENTATKAPASPQTLTGTIG